MLPYSYNKGKQNTRKGDKTNYIIRNPETKRYVLNIDDLGRFEEFYNFIQDLNEKHGEKAIYHLKDGNFSTDEENRFRNILNIWTDTKIA